jgi:hypothetical protein
MALQPAPTPAVVLLHVWTVPTSGVLPAMTRLATDRLALRGYPGLTFAKLLGTGSGQTFAPQDADPHHWALLTCWDAPHAAATFEHSRVVRRWDAACSERLRVLMTPLSSNGQWSGRRPFGTPSIRPGDLTPGTGPVAAITRARIRWNQLPAFWRSVPDVTASLATAPGLRWSLGIGEAPIGLQGTFSVWDDLAAMNSFAYKTAGHRRAIEQTRETGWFSEELFARFLVEEMEGTFDGHPVDV